jgi:hypothetical protein
MRQPAFMGKHLAKIAHVDPAYPSGEDPKRQNQFPKLTISDLQLYNRLYQPAECLTLAGIHKSAAN